jgi:hypothetical protein
MYAINLLLTKPVIPSPIPDSYRDYPKEREYLKNNFKLSLA